MTVSRLVHAVAAVLALAGAAACTGRVSSEERCLSCHAKIERVSASHTGCVSCHGGDARATRKVAAHEGMHGATNRSSPARWELGCAPCHRHQADRLASSQMFTNAGMIAQIQATWEGERPGIVYGAHPGRAYAPDGAPIAQAGVADLDHLSGELYRKFCSRCHLAVDNDATDGAGHPAGCAACHFPYADDATYRGADASVTGTGPHSRTHAMQGLPPMDACTRCHNRSGRIALAFQGLMDGNNALVPTLNGLPGPVTGSDDRTFTHIAPDAHFEAGMECIDCHTSREIMGDGYAAPDMRAQLEIQCEDCHGDGERGPRFAPASREGDAPIRESRQYATRIAPGTRMALTSKDRPYSNVFERDGQVLVLTKRSGRTLRSPVITGTAEHRIAGHGRLGCASCHARTVAQCYGCHTTYDKRETAVDAIAGRETSGAFSETEDYRTLYPFPLALDGAGRITPVTPGCQTFVTVVEADGRRSLDEHVAPYKGKPQLRFAPFSGHNTSARAIGCAECHGNPAFLGFGQHVLERSRVRSTLLCERNPRKALDGFLSMDETGVMSHAAITRAGARPLEAGEVRRALSVNLCVVCHESGKDPIYRTPLNYDALDDLTHRRLLGAGR